MNELTPDGSFKKRHIAHPVPHSSQNLPVQPKLLLRSPLNDQILSVRRPHGVIEEGEACHIDKPSSRFVACSYGDWRHRQHPQRRSHAQ